jgi:hypothetical protein
MKMQIISVRDIKVGQYQRPIACESKGVAIRAFMDACAPGNPSDISKHPRDFELWKVGEFDSETGTLTGCTPEHITSGIPPEEFIRQEKDKYNPAATTQARAGTFIKE